MVARRAQNWTSKKYKQKLQNLATVLTQIGTGDQQKESPTFIGGSEIENRGVLEDLVKEPLMQSSDYGIVHFESPDKRGIDVALLYKKKHFRPISTKNIPLMVYSKKAKSNEKDNKETEEDKAENDKIDYDTSSRIYTRDILLVTGYLDGDEINILVNHWPSRSGGEKKAVRFGKKPENSTEKLWIRFIKSIPMPRSFRWAILTTAPTIRV